jgi:hypothetical protein
MRLGIAIFFLFLAFVSAACRQTKSSAEPSGRMLNSPAAGERLRISFFSKGEGINGTALKKFEAELPKWASAEGIEYRSEKTHWGREGETDICLELSVKNTSSENSKIKTWCRQFAAENDRIYIGENEPCRRQ